MEKRVLVVDDDKINLKLIKNALTKIGMEVLTAEDGLKGLDMARTRKPQIILLDMLIPKIHGLDLCAKIKDDYILEDTSLLLMTAVYKHPSFKQDIQKSGADFYFEKPLDMKKLTKTVREIMERKLSESN